MTKRTREAVLAFPDLSVANDQILGAICRDAAENLDADLVSIWSFRDSPKRIECQFLFDVPEDSVSKGQVLLEADIPIYFESIVEETVISAPIAAEHPMTKELIEPYIIPRGVLSLLDFIVHDNDGPSGIICCESRSKQRRWSEADRSYLRRLAALASFKTRI